MEYINLAKQYGIEVRSIKHGLLIYSSTEFATGEKNGISFNKSSILSIDTELICDMFNIGYTLNGKMEVKKDIMLSLYQEQNKTYLILFPDGNNYTLLSPLSNI